MLLNNYSVRIPEGKEQESGYVSMIHGTRYRIILRNSNSTECNARVEIDGKHQGTWRIDNLESISIERPAHDTGLFTFYKAGSSQALQIGLDANDSKLGLIQVTFTPAKVKEKEPVYRSYGSGQSTLESSRGGSKSFSAGGTGLSGSSNQEFGKANQIELDESRAITISLRLVVEDNEPRPLTSYSNPVPPPIR